MRTYRIKTNDFKNLIKVELLDSELKKQVDYYQKKYNCNIVKAMNKASNIALCITDNSQYIITCKNCYQKSLIDILESVGIDSESIIIDKKEYSSNGQEISLDQLREIILG